MSRRRAAWVAAVVAVLLGATYLLVRRGSRHPAPVASPPPKPAVPATPPPAAPSPAPTPAVHDKPAPSTPAAPVELGVDGTPADMPATTAALSVDPVTPRSWGGGRTGRRRAPSTPREPAEQTAPVEQPLPAWLRASILVVALLAFFAVSLIATKQV